MDPGEKGEKTGAMVDALGEMARLGVDSVIGAVTDVWKIAPLETIGEKVIPAVAGL
jgi:hypothetical protein